MKVLITGSSGQIGTNLGLLLQSESHEVFGVDKRENAWTDEIETVYQDLSAPYQNFKNGIGDTQYPDDIDCVVHFAAHAKVHELVEHPYRALENITMAFNVMEYCRQNKLPVIFGSTREVYGNTQRFITEESHADFSIAESPYAASKISAEALVHSYSACYDIPYIIFRFSNVYGRYDNDLERMERVIPLFIKKISKGEQITIYGEDKTLDFTYVDDCVAGVKQAIELLVSGEAKNHTINLAYGQGNTLVNMAKYIGEALGKEPNIKLESARVGEVTHYIANIGKARALLGYDPKTPLREGLHKSVAWSMKWWEENE